MSHPKLSPYYAAFLHDHDGAAVSDPPPSNSDSLAFVNRGAEVLDVLVPNFMNQLCRSRIDVIMFTPVAAQPQGTGKSALGINICHVLRRPREEPEQEELVARRLRAAWTWKDIGDDCLNTARSDASSDNLVTRVLKHRFPRQAPLLRALQKNNPVFVQLHDLRLTYGSLDEALGFALFSAYTGSSDALKFDAFRKHNSLVSGCVIDIISVIVRRSGGCAMIVLDDINQLGNVRYAKWSGADNFASAAVRLDLAMIALSPTLECLHRSAGCMVYATGHSLSLALKALEGSGTGSLLLFHCPVNLQPLAAHDVLDTLRHTVCASGRALIDEIGVAPDTGLQDFLAHQCASATGGMGKALEALLRGLQRRAVGTAVATTQSEVLAAIEAVRVQVVPRGRRPLGPAHARKWQR